MMSAIDILDRATETQIDGCQWCKASVWMELLRRIHDKECSSCLQVINCIIQETKTMIKLITLLTVEFSGSV